jgi:hypothetical protein
MAEILDLEPVARGEYFDPITFNLKDGNGNPIDLTGATVKMVAKENYRGAEVFDFGATITDALNGQITTTGLILDYPVKMYYFDLFVTIDNEPEQYVKGVLSITESVSR